MSSGVAKQRLHPELAFAGLMVAIYAVALAVTHGLPRLARPGPVAAGVAVDLVVVVPLAFYFLVLRRRGLSIVALVPVLVLSVVGANLILPRDHHQALRVLELLAAPLELGILVWIARRAASSLRKVRDESADPIDRWYRAAFETLRVPMVARVLTTEAAVLGYGLWAWRSRPHAPRGARAFTHHERSGYAGIVLAFLLVVGVEGLAVHFLVASVSPAVAWILTILGAYSGLWLVADYRATVLRPVLAGDETILFRAGLRWTIEVRRTQIAGVESRKPDLGRETLNLTFLGTPTHWITLTETVLARGPYGIERRVRALGLTPDTPTEFCGAIESSVTR